MECRGCGRENRADSRFCDACGGALAVRCSACDRELNADARFCDGCGTSVAAPGGATPPNAAPSTDSEAVRKTVTVLFCDLVGSTAFAESVDTESAREAMSRYHSMAKSMIEANGGMVAKFIGDGVMALFGVPEVAEDDAERAVAAGAGLQRGFVPVRDHIAKRYGVEVGLRVGINTGEVVIDDADADLVGDVLNTAARLEAACVPGQVLVGEETWRLTRSAVGYEPLGEVTVKGKRDGLATYQLVLADDGTGFAVRGGGHPDSTPFIGRDDELGRLRGLFDETLAVSEARLATVIGSPGVGKTRLARELGNTASAEADVVEVRCERAGTATFAPVVDLLQQVAGLDDGDTPEQIVAALRDLVGGEPDAARVVELLGGFVGTANPRSTEDAFFGVRRLVEILGGHRPLVLVIDDIQWAEPLFLDLLEHLAEWSKAAPVLIVGLARPELREIRPALTETGRRVALVVSLEGLDAAATELLAAELLGGAALPSELTAKLPSSTDGNPLFVRELIRMLVDDGVIAQRDDRWVLAVDLDAVEVPPTIQSLLATRVERLPPIERRVLEQASVIGPEFPLGALAELLPEVSRSELELVLERLRRKEQVEPTGTYWGDEPIVRFHHVLIRDAAYRRLLKGARAELHLRVGGWMDRTASGLVGEFEVAIAYHFEQAQLYRRQLGDDDETTGEAGRRAAELLHVAATRALERDDLSAAAGLSRRAIDCHPDDAESLSELLVLACESVLASGDATTGSALVKRLSERALGDARLEAWATCFTAQLAVMTDPTGLQQATEQTQEAAERFEAIGDQAGLAKARIVRAGALARLGQVGAAETELDLALTAARAAGDRRRITAVLSSAPVAALWGPSPVARAGGRCLDVVRLSRITADSPAVVATSSRCQAVLEAMRGRFDTARSLLDASRTTSLELGLDHGLLETSLYAGIVELLADDPIAAEPHLREAFGGLGQLGIGADAGQAAAHLARSLLLQGRLDEADELAADSDALAGQNLQTAIAARSAQAEILAARGDTDPALALADEAVRLATDTDLVFDHANALSTLARVRAAAGDDDGAQRAASAARDLFAQKGATFTVEVTSGASAITAPDAASRSDPSDESLAVEPSDEPWNEAGRLFRRSMQLFTSGDLVAWEAMLDDSLRGSNRDSGAQLEFEDKADFVRLMEVSLEALGVPAGLNIATIATRGDDLELSEMHWTQQDDPTGPRIDYLHISQWSAGRQLTSITFGGDDLRAAVAELDRLYLETVDPIEGMPIAGTARFMDGLMDGDLDRVLAAFHPAVVLADHRPLGWGPTSSFDDLRARWETLTRPHGSIIEMARRFHPCSLSSWCVAIRLVNRTPDGGELIDDHLIVARSDPATGLTVRLDQFADDQLDEAFACFDAAQVESDAVIPAPNTAVRAGGVANARARTASLDEFLATLADDFTATLADGSTVTLDDLRNGTIEPVALGYGVVDRRITSVLTDRLAMLYVGSDDGTGNWSVEEIDDANHLRNVRQFASIAEAADAIEQRWAELGADAADAGVLRVNRAMRTQDAEAMAELLADDFRMEDHRPLGLPPIDRELLLASLGSSDPLIVQCVHAVSSRAQVSRTAYITDSTSGYVWESMVNIAVLGLRDGLLTSIDLFPEDELDAAMARFHELDGTNPPADTPSTSDDEPWNDADRWMRRANEIRTQGHVEEFVDLLAEDIVSEDRQTLAQHIYRGRDEVLAGFQSEILPTIHAETIACRGERLVVQHHVWRSDEADVEYEWLYLTRWSPAGQIVHAVFFDPSDLRAAIEQLDEWYIEELSPIDAARVRATSAYFGATNDRDLDRAVSTLAPDVRSTTHRAISWGELDREGVAAGLATITDSESEVFFANERLELTARTGVLLNSRLEFTDAHGSLLVDRFVTAKRTLPATGLIAQMDHFQHDQSHEARELADRWAAETVADPMVNTAVIAGGLTNALARYGEPGDALCLLADDFTATLADGTIVTLEDLRGGTVDPETLGYGVTQRETIAVRGERLALTRSENSRWSVEQLDDHDRLTRVNVFAHDDLLAAANALDDTARALPENAHMPALFWDYLRAHRNYDLDALAELLDDEFLQIDHRPLGYAPMRKAACIDLYRTGLDDPMLHAVPVYGVLHRAVEDVCLASGGLWMRGSSDDYWTGQPFLAVSSFVNDRMVSGDLFPIDGIDAAMARFHELSGGAPVSDETSPASQDEPWNDADRRSRELNAIWVEGDRDAWADHLDANIRWDDSRPLVGHNYVGRSDVVEGVGPERPGLLTMRCEPVAVRGDHLVLYHQQISLSDDPGRLVLPHLRIDQWNSDGQLTHVASFDPDDLAGAISELNRRYADEIGFDPLALASLKIDELLTARDEMAFMATLDPSCEAVDHRPIGWGTVRIEGVLERVRSLTTLVGDYVSYQARIHRSDPTVHVYTGGYRFTGAEGAVLDELHVMAYAYNPAAGLALRVEQFPLEHLDAALDRADEMAIEYATVPAPNRAVVTSGTANLWTRAGQTDLLLDHFADSFTAILPDGSTVTRDDLVSGAVTPGVLGFGGTRRSVVAVGGERVAMLTVTGEDDSIHWSIEVIDHDGRLREIRQFAVDRIVDAIANYDQCWRDVEGAALPRSIHLIQRFNQYLNHLDPVGLDEVLADDYGLTDHRQMGLGTFDRQQFIGLFEGVTPAADDGAEGLIIRQVHAATERAVVAGQAYLAVSPSGEVWERLVNIATLGVRDGHVTHDDLYEEGELDAAMARFHELDAIGVVTSVDEVAPEHGFDPVGSFTPHVDEIQTRGDVDAFIALLHPSYQIIDHRPLGWGSLDVDGMKERTRTLSDLPGEVVVRTGRVHVLESTFSFLERGYDMTRSDGSTVEDRHLMVTVVDPATGLLLRSEQFGVEQLAEATTRLDELRAEFPFVPTPNQATVTSGSASRWARAGQTELFLDHFADDFTATLTDGSTVTRDNLRATRVEPSALGYRVVDRKVIAVRGERLALLLVEDCWSVEEIGTDGRLIRLDRFAYADLRSAVNHLEARALTHDDAPRQADALVAMRRAVRELDADALESVVHPEFLLTDRRPLGFEPMDRDGFVSFMRSDATDTSFTSVPVISEIIASSAHGSVARNAMWSGGVSGEFWETSPAINVIMVRDDLVVSMDMFADDDLDAAVARFHELDAEARADTPAWNRADRAGRELFRDIGGSRVTSTEVLADDAVVDDRRHLLYNTYVGRDAVIEGWRTTGTVRPWQVEFDTLAVRGENLALIAAHLAKVDDSDTTIESLGVIRVNADSLIDRMVSFDAEDLAAAIDELDRMYAESLDTTNLLEHRNLTVVDLHYSGLNAGDLRTAMVVYHPSSVFIDHRPLGWGTLDLDGIRTRMQTITESPDRYFHYLRRAVRYTSTSLCEIGRNHAVTADGFVNDSDILSIFTMDPATGLGVRTEQFDPENLDAGLERFDEIAAAELATAIPPNRAVLSGGLANLRALDPGPDRFVDGLADDFTATLAHGSAATLDDLRAGAVTPTDLGFGVTERELIAVRGERLALLRVERAGRAPDDSDTVIEQFAVNRTNAADEIDLVVIFDVGDLGAAVIELNRLDAEQIGALQAGLRDTGNVMFEVLTAGDLDASIALVHPTGQLIDHRKLGWGTLGIDETRARFETITENPRHIMVVAQFHDMSASTCCFSSANHVRTAEGAVIVEPVLWTLRRDPVTGLIMTGHQLDPDDVAAARRMFRALDTAFTEGGLPITRAVAAGGMANYRGRLPRPDRFIDGLAEAFTATLADGSTVTLDDLRAGTITPTDLGFGITDRELIAVRGEHLAFIRVEGARWSIEEIDEHDRLVRVTLFEPGDLLAATNALELAGRAMPDADLVPEPIRKWLDAHHNNDVVGQTHLTHDGFSIVDHRELGYGTMDNEDAAALFAVRDEDETLRGVPVYSVIHGTNEQACVLAGAMWTQGGAGDYWIGLPFIGVYGSADDKLRTVDLFAENYLEAAMAHFAEISERPQPTSAERWSGDLTAMINERCLDDFEALLAEDFADDSRRTGYSFVLDRDQYLAGLSIFFEQGLSIEILNVVATAGDLGLLYRCEVAGDDNVSSFLQVGLFDADGKLSRSVEFDDDAQADALAELARVTGEPVTLIPAAASTF